MTQYKTYLLVFGLSALASYLATPLVRWLAFRVGAVDVPDERKIHREPMPRLGGLAVFIGFIFPWALFYLYTNRITSQFVNYEKLVASILAGGLAMVILGLYDDIRGARALKKLFVQVSVALALFYGADLRINVISNPLGGNFELGWLALPVTLLWIVGVTNAINLLDGIDGLAAGVTACIALALAVINIGYDNAIVALLTLCLAGGCVGFLPYNFSPARIFLGDTGSLFIGITLSLIAIVSFFKAATATFIAVPLILFGLPLFDTASVIIGRAMRGVPIFQADKTHVHHRLLRLGLNHRQSALILYGITLVLGVLAVSLSLRQIGVSAAVIVVLMVGITLWVLWGWFRRRR